MPTAANTEDGDYCSADCSTVTGACGDGEVQTNEVLTPTNPFGIKGAGESGTVGGLSCVAAAVDDALVSAGAEKIGMPATPERVWRALRDRR